MFIKKTLKQSIGSKLFSVQFIKADKTKRTMLCKLPTAEKFFSGGELKGNRDHLLEVIDITVLRKTKEPKKSWRSINLNTITSLNDRDWETLHH